MVLVVPAHDAICPQCSEISANPADNSRDVRHPPDTGNNIRGQTGESRDHPGCQFSTLQCGVTAFSPWIGAECWKLHLQRARGIIRMECFEKGDNTRNYTNPGTTI